MDAAPDGRSTELANHFVRGRPPSPTEGGAGAGARYRLIHACGPPLVRVSPPKSALCSQNGVDNPPRRAGSKPIHLGHSGLPPGGWSAGPSRLDDWEQRNARFREGVMNTAEINSSARILDLSASMKHLESRSTSSRSRASVKPRLRLAYIVSLAIGVFIAGVSAAGIGLTSLGVLRRSEDRGEHRAGNGGRSGAGVCGPRSSQLGSGRADPVGRRVAGPPRLPCGSLTLAGRPLLRALHVRDLCCRCAVQPAFHSPHRPRRSRRVRDPGSHG